MQIAINAIKYMQLMLLTRLYEPEKETRSRKDDDKKNIYRSPRSEIIFEHLPACRPPSFFIAHYLLTS
jgi:hypothetical protein